MTAPDDRQSSEYTEAPDEVRQALQRCAAMSVSLPVTAARSMLDTLRHVEEFLRCHADAAVLAELRSYCTGQDWSPACSPHAFIDRIGLHTLTLHHAISTAGRATHATTDTVSNHDKEPA